MQKKRRWYFTKTLCHTASSIYRWMWLGNKIGIYTIYENLLYIMNHECIFVLINISHTIYYFPKPTGHKMLTYFTKQKTTNKKSVCNVDLIEYTRVVTVSRGWPGPDTRRQPVARARDRAWAGVWRSQPLNCAWCGIGLYICVWIPDSYLN